ERGAWRLTFGRSHEIPGFVKRLMPPQQSWGVSYVCLGGVLNYLSERDSESFFVPARRDEAQ
ncbi:MAG: hypothetical protein KZQ76_10490, partial [Candidatus Thiodiazotropha sp. (ex Epidulcina cf. delphinae)]|nr:hypothetical protein [Candidatus Thiodiazotropha sp. (ex Epidulcina cf. delphinae)]